MKRKEREIEYSKRNIGQTIFVITIIGIIVIAAAAITTQLPHMWDDWSWGSVTGINRLKKFFIGYNGRYLGNIFVIIVTRSKAILAVSYGICVGLLAYLAHKYTNEKGILSVAIVIMSLFLMPKFTGVQVLLWTPGFANYIPPTCILFLYLVIVKNIFDDDEPKYSKHVAFLTFLLGFCGGFFLENVTLLGVELALLVIIIVFLKYKKFFGAHIAYMIGAIISAILMFINPSYGFVPGKENDVHKVGGRLGIADTLAHNTKKICSFLIDKNVAFLIFISIAVLIFTIYALKKSDTNKSRKKLLAVVTSYEIIFTAFITLRRFVPIINEKTKNLTLLIALLGVVYYIFLLLIPFIQKKKFFDGLKLAFPLILAYPVMIPLLVVTPISYRCMFQTYMFISLFICLILNEVFYKISITSKNIIVVIILIVLAFPFASEYAIMQKASDFEKERIDYIYSQIEDGNTTVYLAKYPQELYSNLPHNRFVKSKWETNFKRYYKIEDSIKVKQISYQQYLELKSKNTK